MKTTQMAIDSRMDKQIVVNSVEPYKNNKNA